MTLKEELEILRGEPIEEFPCAPEDVPCIETSDAEKLCKHPVVSVNMITYNHEPYIRQAIEGVMMQKTDFEFELIIGEDCSQDKTREICFEYQKKYPDKIRVLWWHENVSKLGGNSRRCRAHSRGEFIAFCEGDDYWIDPLKLQKQVDVMRKYPSVGFCFCGSKIFHGATGQWSSWNSDRSGFQPGFLDSRHYCLWTMFGKNPYAHWGNEFWQMTATFLVRSSVLKNACQEYEIFKWRLCVGDSVFCLGIGSLSDAYYLADETAVYRQMPSGVTISRGGRCGLDTLIVRMYYLRRYLHLEYADMPDVFVERVLISSFSVHGKLKKKWFLDYEKRIHKSGIMGYLNRHAVRLRVCDYRHDIKNGLLARLSPYLCDRRVPEKLVGLYADLNDNSCDWRAGRRKPLRELMNKLYGKIF